MFRIRVRRISYSEAYEMLRERGWLRACADILHGSAMLALPFVWR